MWIANSLCLRMLLCLFDFASRRLLFVLQTEVLMWTCRGTCGLVMRCSFSGGLQRQQNSAQFCDTLLQTEGEKEGKLQSSLWCKTMYKMHNWVILSWLILYVKVSQSQPTAASLQLSARTCLRSFQPPPHLHLDRSVSSSSRPWRPRLCSSWLVCFTLVCWR